MEIFKSDLSNVACDNTPTVDRAPRRAFIMQDPSEYVQCGELPKINLLKWADPICRAEDE